MKDMSRALRRHHAARLKRARRFYFGFDNRTGPRRYGMVAFWIPIVYARA